MSVQPGSEEILSIKNLKKHFGNVKAVDGLNISIHRGEIYGLLGPNGAGKTTTIKAILGMLEPTEGSVEVFGLDPERDELKVKTCIGYVSEEPLIYKSLTPEQLFNFISSVRNLDGSKVSKNLAEYLDALNALPYYRKLIATLSRGNKQKVQIIAALLHEPEILILDEPLAGLDAKSVKVVKELLQLHIQRGGAVLFSTHIMEVAEDLCTRIGIINKGRLVAEGTIAELRNIANQKDLTLEEIFLNLTSENGSISEIINRLKGTMN